MNTDDDDDTDEAGGEGQTGWMRPVCTVTQHCLTVQYTIILRYYVNTNTITIL